MNSRKQEREEGKRKMRKTGCNKDWIFYESNESLSFVYEKSRPRQIDLPHDFIITKPRSSDAAGGALNGYFGDGQGVYKKELIFSDSQENKTVILDIDGAYMNTEVILNGELLGMHPYGYTPYQVDLTPVLHFDGKSNELKIITQSRQPSSRWYTGGGLYRSVALWTGGSIYLKPGDAFVFASHVNKEKADINFEVAVTSKEKQKKEVFVLCEVLDILGQTKATVSKALQVDADSCTVCRLTAELLVPHLWDMDDPYLYTYRITVSDNYKTTLDIEENLFGVRTISADVRNGLCLNGQSIKLRGGCIHHDNGLLGACAYPKAEERKIKIMQKAGYNAVRISHHPPSLAMLEACDRLGMLLLDECFDVWRMGKRPLDYHLYFEDWWERDIEWMVKRDRNHPSVIVYSIGNEIGERDGTNDGALWAGKLNHKFKSLDPTRLTLSAICNIFEPGKEPRTNFDANLQKEKTDIWGEKTKDYAASVDIVGYNYLLDRYEKDHGTFPERVIAGTESHAFNTYEYWEKVKKDSWVIGDFIWAAVDYLGEAGVGKVYWKKQNEPFSFMGAYPWRTSWQSDIMLTGKRRPQSYYRELMWGHTKNTWLFTTHPRHYGDEFYGTGWHWPDVNADWSFEEAFIGRMVRIYAYGPGGEAEFRVNGTIIGRKGYEKNMAVIDIPYTPGMIEVITYQNNSEISRAEIRSAGQAASIELTPEDLSIEADGQDIAYIQICIRDKSGVLLPEDDRKLTATVSKNAELIAVGSGSPCTTDQIGSNSCHAFQGEAMAIIKAHNKGKIRITVYDETGIRGECTTEAK